MSCSDTTQDLFLTSPLTNCPGDNICISSVLLNLHLNYPGRFRTHFDTRIPELWQHNPYQTPRHELKNPRHIPLYFGIHDTEERRMHFIEFWLRSLSDSLGLPIPLLKCRGDLYLTKEECERPIRDLTGSDEPYWLLCASHKTDCRTKWYPTESWQSIVDGLAGKVKFVRPAHKPTFNPDAPNAERDIGGNHFVPPLRGVVELAGKTGIRDSMRLVYHAEGIVCCITFLQHLAAALPRPPGKTAVRPCVVIAGSREGQFVTQYPGQNILHTIGAMDCCSSGGCWKSHVVDVGAMSDRCLRPSNGYAECMKRVSPERVIQTVLSMI